MNIANTRLPLLVSAVRDAVTYNDNLLTSQTLRNRDDYEEHMVELTQLLEFLKSEYKKVEEEIGLPMEKIL